LKISAPVSAAIWSPNAAYVTLEAVAYRQPAILGLQPILLLVKNKYRHAIDANLVGDLKFRDDKIEYFDKQHSRNILSQL
jgi:hypothetical protein